MSNTYQSCATILPTSNIKEISPDTKNVRKRHIRALVAYWILGLCNNYGYVVMLTAANDIISENSSAGHSEKSKARDCTYMSTGAILLADILPALLIKIFAPFIPFLVNIRIGVCVLFSAGGFLAVAFSENMFVSLLGVVLTSFCSGLGEVTYLQYSSFFDRNVVSSWSSGTGGAGVIGALSYAVLQSIGLKTTLLIMLIVPCTMGLTFFILLPNPSEDVDNKLATQRNVNEEELRNPKETIIKKLRIIPGLMKYIIPFALVYIFEYFINQGTFELITFEDSFVAKTSQYRWLQVTYQIGVFLSRSSVNLFHIKQTWIMAVFQAINVVIFTTEAIYYYIPSFYIVVALVLWEGLLGGSSYVNTFYRITNEVPEDEKQFSMAITGFGDSFGISLAGVFAILAHNAICDIPLPSST